MAELLLLCVGALAGLIAGSFIGLVGERWPRGEQVIAGRSRCDRCRHVLGAAELIPLVSYAVQRGRCRHCDTAIPLRLPAVEAIAALIGVGAVAAAQTPLDLAWAAAGWALLALAVLDLRAFWLPNRLTIPLLATGLSFHAAGGDRLAFLYAALGALAGLLSLWAVAGLYELVRKRPGLGGGDPKLFAALGAWFGIGALPVILLASAVIGLLAVAGMSARGTAISGETRLPLGTLMAIGAGVYAVYAVLVHPMPFGVPVP